MKTKPKCKLIGEDGNVFNLIGLVSKTLRQAGLLEQAEEFIAEAMVCGSYNEVLNLCGEYVEIT